MFYRNSFNKNFFIRSNKYKKNLVKTKKNFKVLKSEIDDFEIPMLESYDNSYFFDFSKKLVKKFYKYKNIIIIGMGGSILGTKSIYYFCKNKIKKNVFFFDNLDDGLCKKIKRISNYCLIVVSKSGETLETITNFSILFSKFSLKNKLVFITEIKDSSLIEIANKTKAEIIEHKSYIGGRYSVLSEVGMFPAALMGLDIKKFANLKKLISNNFFVSTLIKNVATIYSLSEQGFKNSIILNYDSGSNYLGYWYQQLVGESLGKNKKGIMPILSFGPKDHHSLLQLYLDGPRNNFFTFINFKEKKNKPKILNRAIPSSMNFLKYKNLGFIINSQCSAVKKAFKKKKIPFRQITLKNKNEKELGEIITFFVLETILLSKLMNVNPFDQPAVEEVKIETKKFLK
tara:strand:- start:2188 stop:3387 length:1200 start_codon:yes stop_codon:yes gene_type:complete